MTLPPETIPVTVIGAIKIDGPIDTRAANILECAFQPQTFDSTVALANSVPILNHAPKRERAVLTFTGNAAGDSCLLCASLSDAQHGQGALVTTDASKTHTPITLATTGEVWLAPVTGKVLVGVISELRALP
jgi:hypothetical protein